MGSDASWFSVKGRLSCFHFMAKMAVLSLVVYVVYLYVHYCALDFSGNPLESLKNLIWLHDHRYYGLSIIGVFLIYTSIISR